MVNTTRMTTAGPFWRLFKHQLLSFLRMFYTQLLLTFHSQVKNIKRKWEQSSENWRITLSFISNPSSPYCVMLYFWWTCSVNLKLITLGSERKKPQRIQGSELRFVFHDKACFHCRKLAAHTCLNKRIFSTSFPGSFIGGREMKEPGNEVGIFCPTATQRVLLLGLRWRRAKS